MPLQIRFPLPRPGGRPPALAVAAAPAGAVALSPEDQAAVDQASAYLDGLGELKGRFVQTDPRGGREPGRALPEAAGPGPLRL